MSKKGIPLECPGCGRQWTYKGSQRYYATCPDCKTSVKIEKHRIREPREDDDAGR